MMFLFISFLVLVVIFWMFRYWWFYFCLGFGGCKVDYWEGMVRSLGWDWSCMGYCSLVLRSVGRVGLYF